jgi:hypothetical protein
MPFVPAPNIVMVEWRCTRNNQQIENRLMVDALAAPTPAILQDIAQTAWDWWENNHANVISTEVNLREVVATDLSVQNGGQYTYAPDTTTVGTLGGFDLPNEVSMCVSLRTGSRGRSARGRWYSLSVTDAQLSGTNTMSPAAITALTSSINALLTTLTNAGYAAVIVSYRTNNAPRPGGPVYFVITSATIVDDVLDSMRRRKPGVGS